MTVSRQSQRYYALLSGIFGATASCIAKVALSPDSKLFSLLTPTSQAASQYVCAKLNRNSNSADDAVQTCEVSLGFLLYYIPRGLCFLCSIVLNVVMVGSFLEGMEESGSVAGTALSSGSNFIVSAIYGFCFWGEIETFSCAWLTGFILILVGVTLLSTVQAVPTPSPS